MAIECEVFLDTNALIQLIDNDKLIAYQSFPALRFTTFEKCIYEWKNGLKRYFINVEFLLRTIKQPTDQQSTKWEERQADLIVAYALNSLSLNPQELEKLIKALKTYDLRYEFGIALEHEWTSPEEMEETFYAYVRKDQYDDTDLLRLKQFYKLIRDGLRASLHELDQWINSYNIRVVYYDQVFGDPLQTSKFRSIMDDSYLPSEDLEIIFSAMCSHCQLFVTTDLKIINHSRTLGLNHCLEFIHTDQLDHMLSQYVSDIYTANISGKDSNA